ncbi:MAG: HK97 gp10 family phage protein [Oscillospiraceae bacterium]
MSKMGKFKASDLQKFQKQLSQLQESTETFVELCAKELAARLLRKVIERTPVGHYSEKSGKKGGTLKRGWTVSEIRQQGKLYTVDVANIVEYASYVEFGHRTPNHQGWVPGRFMLTISEEELQQIAPKVLESKIRKILKEYMK